MEYTDATQAGHWLSVREAAAVAGVSRQSVHRWIAQGRVSAVAGDDGYRVDSAELTDFLVLRRAAYLAGVTVSTLETWTGDAGATA